MSIPKIAAGLLFCTAFLACQKEAHLPADETAATEAVATRKGGTAAMKGTEFYALTANNEIIRYRSGNPLEEVSATAITGLPGGERLLAIDFRPATGELFAVSNASQLYTLNLQNGMAMPVGARLSPLINGDFVGFDFNPTVDRIRLVTNTGQNLRINPATGVAIVDGTIAMAGANITAVAYTNSFAGATTTALYDIDLASDMLYLQSPPNNGTLVPVGPLGVQATGEAGFDIAPDNSVAIAALYGRGQEDGEPETTNGNKYRFYYINLSTGEAKNAGKTDRVIVGVAIAPMP